MANVPINTTLTVTDVIQPRAAQVASLLQTYFPGQKIYDGYRPLGEKFWQTGQGQLSFPCIMVEATESKAEMYTTGTWDREISFDIIAYLTDSNPDTLGQTQRRYCDAFVKLFSNNAKGDITLATASFNYKILSGFWYNSKIKGMTMSPIFRWPEPNVKWMRAVVFKYWVIDRIIE